ncbi:hypothetical protein D3C85_1912990 [compost metagenome]
MQIALLNGADLLPHCRLLHLGQQLLGILILADGRFADSYEDMVRVQLRQHLKG